MVSLAHYAERSEPIEDNDCDSDSDEVHYLPRLDVDEGDEDDDAEVRDDQAARWWP